MLYLVGLGVDEGDLSLKAFDTLKSADCALVRSEKPRAAQALKQAGVQFTSLDYIYEKSRSFETLKKNFIKKIKEELKNGSVCYAVDGAVSEDLIASELVKVFPDCEVIEGTAKAGVAAAKFGLSGSGYSAYSAYDRDFSFTPTFPLVVYDLDDAFVASDWKLFLEKHLGDEAEVGLYVDNRMLSLPVYELDRDPSLFNYSTVLVAKGEPFAQKKRFCFDDLLKIVETLRGENGCPWDKAQTLTTLRKHLIEECYELVDAIDRNDDSDMLEETGDLLLQAAFFIILEEEKSAFDRTDVLSRICEKLVFRHTHIFGGDKAENAEEALNIWTKNKQIEKEITTATEYIAAVPKSLPSCLRASKCFKRGVESGLEVDAEELAKEVALLASADLKSEKLGELLFKTVALVKLRGGDPETALADETEAFIKTVERLEKKLGENGSSLKRADANEIKAVADEIKKS